MEGHEYPFQQAHEQENDCRVCHEPFNPTFVYQPKLVDHNEVMRRDTIEYTTTCPHCKKDTVAYFVYYYD